MKIKLQNSPTIIPFQVKVVHRQLLK